MTDDDVDLLKERPPNRRGRPKGSKNKCKDPAIRAETRVAMAQCGVRNVKELTPEFVRRA